LLTDLQDRTQLTRKSLVKILTESRRLKDFKRNPQAFIDVAAEVINRTKRLALVDGIKYQRIGDESYFAQELFQREELTGYLRNILKDAIKSVFQHVVYDSAGVERDFAEQLERNQSVKVYAKLPAWFKVPTPLGSYNPDWAVLVQVDSEERLYFVVETKGSLFADDLRDSELAKIACGKAHFQALATGADSARYIQAVTIDDVMNLC
jgi:type III restriction enzyme